MAKNSRAFMDVIALAQAQCKSDREFIPLLRFALAQMDAKRATRKTKPPKPREKAVEAVQAAVRG